MEFTSNASYVMDTVWLIVMMFVLIITVILMQKLLGQWRDKVKIPNYSHLDFLTLWVVVSCLCLSIWMSFSELPKAMKACETQGLKLAQCSSHCGCTYYGCVNATEQEENRKMDEGCLLI